MPRSELVILREEFTKVAAENLRLHGALAKRDAMLAEKDGEIARLKKYAAAARAAGADAAAALEASYDARLSALLEENRRMREELAALKGSNKRLAASDRRHNGPHSPSSSNSWTAERQSRKAAERRHARQADWRPPGRSTGHPGATRNLIPNRPDGRFCSKLDNPWAA